jgi:two-component system, chemotaxis family, protein-glutamate methylesterase/glutaminase
VKPVQPFSIIVVAASYGGPRALVELVKKLRADIPVPIVIVQHLAATRRSNLPEILRARTDLPVEWAQPGRAPLPAHLYLAPPAAHLVFGSTGLFESSEAAPVHFTRPAADVLFSSAVRHYGARVLGVVLTGRGMDGSEGAQAIRAAGGIVIVQDPLDCAAAGMPSSVLDHGGADFVLPLHEIPDAIASLLEMPVLLN